MIFSIPERVSKAFKILFETKEKETPPEKSLEPTYCGLIDKRLLIVCKGHAYYEAYLAKKRLEKKKKFEISSGTLLSKRTSQNFIKNNKKKKEKVYRERVKDVKHFIKYIKKQKGDSK